MRHGVVIVGMALLVVLGVTPIESVGAQPAPAISVTPSSATVGTLVTVDGSGFQAGQPLVILFGTLQSAPLATGSTDSSGQVDIQFPVPPVGLGGHQVFVCTNYNPSAAVPCRQSASTVLTVIAVATTTSTTPPTPTTTAPLVTETTGTQPTTTSSLSLQGLTTTTTQPPGFDGPIGAAFTTTSTSLQIPPNFLDPGDPPFFPDLEILGVEVTQVIQDMANRMPLVEGKKTLVRVYLGIDQPPGDIGGVAGGTVPQPIGPEGWSPVDGLLHLQRGSETLIVYADNAPITAFVEGSDRHDLDQTLNFLLPPAWTSGDVTITAFIWSDHPHTALYIESDSGNNFAVGSVTFHEPTAPQILVWRLDPVGSPALSDIGYQSALATITESFQMRHPVDTPNFIVMFPPLGPGPVWSGNAPSDEWDFEESSYEPNDRMKWIYYMSNLSGGIRFLGLIPSSTPREWAGLASTPVAWSIPNETTPAHEAAHFYGVSHAPCKDEDDNGIPDELLGGPVDWTYPHGLPFCSIGPISPNGYYGTNLWESPMEIYSNDPSHSNARFPWMGYLHPRWTDTYHYCKMGLVYNIPCDPTAIGVPPEILVPPVDCGPAQGNGFQLDLCLAVEPVNPLMLEVGPIGSLALAVPEVSPQTWVVVEVDVVAGAVVHAVQVPTSQALESEFAFLVERAKKGDVANRVMLRVTDADGHILVQVPVDTHASGFEEEGEHTDESTVVPIPWPSGAASLDLLVEGDVIDGLNPSGSPVVSIDPLGPDVSRQFDLTWSGQDPDGDELLYTLRWSADAGSTWRVIDTGYPDTAAHIDADALQLPGGAIHIEVIASDGLSTGSAQLGPLNIPTGGPTGFLVGPPSVPQHGSEELTFHASDPEDGVITTGVWASDRDGGVGEGRIISTRHLSLGTHLMSVTIVDSDGNQANLTMNLEVEASDLPAPRHPGSVPEAELIVGLGPGNLDQYRPEVSAGVTETTSSPQPGGGPSPAGMLWLTLGAAAVLAGGLVWRRMRDRRS